MILYLAALEACLKKYLDKGQLDLNKHKINCLSSFYTTTDTIVNNIPNFKNFVLDSGVFSLMSQKNAKINYMDYTIKYCGFINKHDIKLFFEMDLYGIIGLDETKKLRNFIEQKTNKKSIPVLHPSVMSIDTIKEIITEYDYIAVGCSGKNDSKFANDTKKVYQFCKWILQQKPAIKIHLLGFSRDLHLFKNLVYSCDSSTWLCWEKFREIPVFHETKMVRLKQKELIENADVIALLEFKKYCDYLEKGY